jgi:YD repeat-containing protein
VEECCRHDQAPAQRHFDALGRTLTDVGGVGQTTTTSYDNNSNWVSITDPRGHISYRSSDVLNRMTKFRDPVKNLTQIAYDSHSRFLTVTDPKNNATTYVYDGFGEAIQEISPDAGKTVYLYDKDGNVSSETDAAPHGRISLAGRTSLRR